MKLAVSCSDRSVLSVFFDAQLFAARIASQRVAFTRFDRTIILRPTDADTSLTSSVVEMQVPTAMRYRVSKSLRKLGLAAPLPFRMAWIHPELIDGGVAFALPSMVEHVI